MLVRLQQSALGCWQLRRALKCHDTVRTHNGVQSRPELFYSLHPNLHIAITVANTSIHSFQHGHQDYYLRHFRDDLVTGCRSLEVEVPGSFTLSMC